MTKRRSQPKKKSIGSYSRKLAAGHKPDYHRNHTDWKKRKEQGEKYIILPTDFMDSMDSMDSTNHTEEQSNDY